MAVAGEPTNSNRTPAQWLDALLRLPTPALLAAACAVGVVAAGAVWWTMLRGEDRNSPGDVANSARSEQLDSPSPVKKPANATTSDKQLAAETPATNAVSAIFARTDQTPAASKPGTSNGSKTAPIPSDRMMAPLQRPKPVLPQLSRVVPQPSEIELLKLGLELADEPVSLRELYDAQAVEITSELPPESPSGKQNYRLPLRIKRNGKRPPGAISLVISTGTYLKPLRVTQIKGKTDTGLNRDECDLVVYQDHKVTWPADAQQLVIKDVPVFVSRPAKFYPSSASVFELRDLRSSSEAMLFDDELRREDLGVRQMAVAKKMGARVNVSAYFNIFPTPRFHGLTDAQRALLDDAGLRGDKTARPLELERQNRPTRRRDFAAHHRRIEVKIGDDWRIWYLTAERDGRYFAMQGPFELVGAWFNRPQVRLKEDYARERTDLLARAKNGELEAQARLGREYLSSRSLIVRADAKEALRWNRLAAEQGNVSAMMNMVFHSQKGWGIERDLPTAFGWLKRAAETGYAPAQTMLAVWYSEGQGVDRNLAEAKRWIETALKSGSAAAQFQYSRMLIDGAAYPRNEVEGYKWIAIAAQRGYEPAANYLAREAIATVAWTLAIEYMKNPSVGSSHQSSTSNDPYRDDPTLIWEHQRGIDDVRGYGPTFSNWTRD